MPWVKRLVARHKQNIDHLRISQDGQHLLCISSDGVAHLWDVQSHKHIRSFSSDTRKMDSFSVSSSGKWVASIEGAAVMVWDIESGNEIPVIMKDQIKPNSICFHPTKPLFAIGLNRGNVLLWNLNLNMEDTLLQCGSWAMGPIAFSQSGELLAVSEARGNLIHLWEFGKREPHSILSEHIALPSILSFVNDERELVSSDLAEKTIVWDVGSKQKIAIYPSGTAFDVNKDRSLLAIGDEMRIRVIDAEENLIKEIKNIGFVYEIKFSPVDNSFFAARGKGLVHQWTNTIPKSELASQIISSEAWIFPAVKYLREQGFFTKYHHLSEKEFHDTIIGLEGGGFRSESMSKRASEYGLVMLLTQDRDRIWWMDMECVYDDDVYTKTLTQWAEISRSSFSPQNINEEWSEDFQHVKVTFRLNDKLYSIEPWVNHDWFDLSILGQINKFISDTANQFAVFDEPRDQTAIVVCLTFEERGNLETDLGLTFNDKDISGRVDPSVKDTI